jgi:phosphoribosylaminoimidazole-succinocarboxamide synthase
MLPSPIFTPATKAELGEHDENVDFEHVSRTVGEQTAIELRDLTLRIYSRAEEIARERGLILADTKFEFGWGQNDSAFEGRLVLADEVLTPDSSRFWPAADWQPGSTPPSFDKQPVRDYLDGLDWDKQPPAPPLPAEVVNTTSARYIDAYERITGRSFADWHG